MFTVGVDVSSGRSMVAVLGTRWKIVMNFSFKILQIADGLADLVETLYDQDGKSQIVMEHTGRYYEPFPMSMYHAGFFVSAVNPRIRRMVSTSVRSRQIL